MSQAIDHTRTLRGAICGAAAAAVWALQQPVDKRVFDCEYDDVELLGKALVRADGWYPAGFAMHMAGGALFGAVYSVLAPALPVPPPLRGPAAAMVEHFGLWPLVAVTDRVHPRRQELPKLAGNRRALSQATWRHLLFGTVLGELERRVNAVVEPAPPEPEAPFSSNGHGSLQHALTVTEATGPERL